MGNGNMLINKLFGPPKMLLTPHGERERKPIATNALPLLIS